VTFEEKQNNLPRRLAVNGQFLLGNSNFLKFPEKAKFSGNLSGKSKFFSEIARRNRNFSKICLGKSQFFCEIT